MLFMYGLPLLDSHTLPVSQVFGGHLYLVFISLPCTFPMFCFLQFCPSSSEQSLLMARANLKNANLIIILPSTKGKNILADAGSTFLSSEHLSYYNLLDPPSAVWTLQDGSYSSDFAPAVSLGRDAFAFYLLSGEIILSLKIQVLLIETFPINFLVLFWLSIVPCS